MATVYIDINKARKNLMERHDYRLDCYYVINGEEFIDSFHCFSYYDVQVFKGNLCHDSKEYYKFVVVDLEIKK